MSNIKNLIMELEEETEFYSMCCSAPPLYDLNNSGPLSFGHCMKCRNGSVFYIEAKIAE